MDHALRFVYRYGNLLHKYYPLLDGLVKSGIPDNRPIGQHSYKVEITDCTKVMVDLRGVIRAEHVNRQKSFFFTGTSDINCAFISARRACLEMHDNPPPPPVRKYARCLQQNRDKSQSQASQEAKPELRRLLPLADGRCDQAADCPRPVHAPQNHESVPAPLVVDVSYPDLASDDDSTASWDGNSDSIVPDSPRLVCFQTQTRLILISLPSLLSLPCMSLNQSMVRRGAVVIDMIIGCDQGSEFLWGQHPGQCWVGLLPVKQRHIVEAERPREKERAWAVRLGFLFWK